MKEVDFHSQLTVDLMKMEEEVNFDLLNDMRVNYQNVQTKMKEEYEAFLKRREEQKKQKRQKRKLQKPIKTFCDGFSQTFVDQKTVLSGDVMIKKLEAEAEKLTVDKQVNELTKSLMIINAERLTLNTLSLEAREKELKSKVTEQFAIKDANMMDKLMENFIERLILNWDDLLNLLLDDVITEECIAMYSKKKKYETQEKLEKVKVLVEYDMDTVFNRVSNIVRLQQAFKEVKHDEDVIFAKYGIQAD